MESWTNDDFMSLGGAVCCLSCPTREANVNEYIKEDGFTTVTHKKKSRKKTQRYKEVSCLMKEGTLDQVSEDRGWEKITLKVDSGAIDTCIPPSVGKAFKLEESAMSKYKAEYRAASGTKIKNHGQRKYQPWVNHGALSS